MRPFVSDHPSLPTFEQLKGKTIKECRGFYKQSTKDVHQSERVIIEFTDGTVLDIVAGSNLFQFRDRIKIEDVNIDFIFNLK